MHACLTVHMIREGYENGDLKGIYKLTKEHRGERVYVHLPDFIGI